MIRLTATNDRNSTKWYFRSQDDCEIFKKVLADNGYNINWISNVVDKSAIPYNAARDADGDPTQRGYLALAWAREYSGDTSTSITDKQQDFLDFISTQKVEKGPEPIEFIDKPVNYDSIYKPTSSKDLGGIVCPLCHGACKITIDDNNVSHVEKCSCGYVTDESMADILHRYKKVVYKHVL